MNRVQLKEGSVSMAL
ncbi:tetracycline resistance efflux system leader peptide [Bacillus velezensis]|nr:tetracycline resistance efflux system leader peptide [Bacillus velezensis]MCR6614888.1 tetracycline resistance efflux system leader peptide [Bacillus amyloliquefaciens]MCA1327483.1 tetracycline resistance efflux system leader peptide [Bacillus velezensis]MCC2531564.1 tetracycline resistance efflux system leader peptide [Bacillus velezensis]MCC2549844.1 tetracycline resistance efflux system leader peptide [Bacillus velezensis]